MVEFGAPLQEKLSQASPEFVQFLSQEKFMWVHELLDKLTEHSPWTTHHSLRVAYICYRQAILSNLPESELIALTLSGALHDIGKLDIDAPRLNSFQPKSDLEDFKKHPRDGYNKLTALPYPEAHEAAEILIGHHKFQRNSYPDDVELIPGTQLYESQSKLAIADGVDAMLSDDRPYQGAFPCEEVLLRLSEVFPEAQVEQAILIRSELFQ